MSNVVASTWPVANRPSLILLRVPLGWRELSQKPAPGAIAAKKMSGEGLSGKRDIVTGEAKPPAQYVRRSEAPRLVS